MTKRVGLYLRVSTKNGQTVDNQRQALTEASARRQSCNSGFSSRTRPLTEIPTTPGVIRLTTGAKVWDPLFRRFFNLQQGPIERETEAAGSGVIVDATQSYVLTNAHVVENATNIEVTTKDKSVGGSDGSSPTNSPTKASVAPKAATGGRSSTGF